MGLRLGGAGGELAAARHGGAGAEQGGVAGCVEEGGGGLWRVVGGCWGVGWGGLGGLGGVGGAWGLPLLVPNNGSKVAAFINQ